MTYYNTTNLHTTYTIQRSLAGGVVQLGKAADSHSHTFVRRWSSSLNLESGKFFKAGSVLQQLNAGNVHAGGVLLVH